MPNTPTIDRDAWTRAQAWASLLERQVWQPIDTAPKDGTEILGWNYHLGRHIVSWAVQPCHNPHPAWISSTCRTNHLDPPTHWMPLPTPPNTGEST